MLKMIERQIARATNTDKAESSNIVKASLDTVPLVVSYMYHSDRLNLIEFNKCGKQYVGEIENALSHISE